MHLTFVKWIQHPVGHGGFHTGYARTDEEPAFHWVFDCGARGQKFMGKALKRELSSWMATTPKEVDWLFISHFDLDHVRGLDDLLTAKTMRGVMLPYVNEHELIHTLCEAIATSDAPEWYVRFLEDPGGWLAERGVEQIVFLEGADGSDGPRDLEEEPRPDEPRKEGSWSVALAPPPRTAARIGRSVIAVARGGVCNVTASNGRATLRLRPYRAPTDPFRHIFLLTALQHIAGWSPSGVNPAGPGTSGLPGLGGLAAMVAEAARTEAGRKSIQMAYAVAIGSSNRSSLSLMSAPEIQATDPGRFGCAIKRDGVWARVNDPALPAWINTGDAELRDPADLSGWRRRYRPWLNRIRVLALPHHGSDHNSGLAFQNLNQRALLAAHVSKGASKHPGSVTTTNAGCRLVKVTGEPDSRLEMLFVALT